MAESSAGACFPVTGPRLPPLPPEPERDDPERLEPEPWGSGFFERDVPDPDFFFELVELFGPPDAASLVRASVVPASVPEPFALSESAGASALAGVLPGVVRPEDLRSFAAGAMGF